MEYSNADLVKELTALSTKIAQLDPDVQRAAIDVAMAKKIMEEQSRAISKLEEDKAHLLQVLAEQSEELKRQQLTDTKHSEEIDKLFRYQSETQKRLDGNSITNLDYPTYEAVRETITQVFKKLEGKGGLSYDDIVNSLTNTRFLGQVFKYTVGLFGVSGVIAAGVAITGVGGDGKVSIKELAGEVNTLKSGVVGNDKKLEDFKLGEFRAFKDETKSDIKEVKSTQNRQWEALLKK